MGDMATMFWIWLAFAVIFLILELVTPTLFFVCFVIGSIAAAVFSHFQPESYYWQIGLFLAVSIVLFPLTRKFARRITKDQPESANIDRLIGKTAIVIKPISPSQSGQVKFEGEVWGASADQEIGEATTVRIKAVAGTRLNVEKL